MSDEQKNLLIIEDDLMVARALAVRFKAEGYKVNMAFDALTGLTTAKKLMPDLVLLDINMPAGNGFDVAERIIRQVPTVTPIIFITASKEPGLRERAEELGASGFFEKPYEAQELVGAVREALGS